MVAFMTFPSWRSYEPASLDRQYSPSLWAKDFVGNLNRYADETAAAADSTVSLTPDREAEKFHSEAELRAEIGKVEAEMRSAAANLEFERAASLTRNARERTLLLERAAACARDSAPLPQ